MTKRWGGAVAAIMMAAALAACGGASQGTPTALPASVVRPVQSTPIYSQRADVFIVATPHRTPIFVAPTPEPLPAAALSAVDAGPVGWTALLAMEQPPSGIGIATGGAAIYEEPGGRVIKSVPGASVLSVTGISADGRWLSVYDKDAVYGWTPAGQVVLYGADDLTIVQKAVDPGVVATLIADVMQPVTVLDDLMATLEATPQPIPQPIPQPTP
ncbi:MAG: hypothetical protein IAE81_18025 [Caldilineaceae bacterium]|jgi:hypothetical protein|nr:hypothetical protein [Caldilineaceae bacterium]